MIEYTHEATFKIIVDDETPRNKFWLSWYEGDMEGLKHTSPINLNLEDLPPGTIVTIQIPICPQCKYTQEDCTCGFNWEEFEGNFEIV